MQLEFCSAKCATTDYGKRRIKAKHAAREVRRFDCPNCQKPVETTNLHIKFCGARCGIQFNRRKHGRNRWAKLKGGHLDPTPVFERAGYRCQECRKKTPIELRGTFQPNSPTCDHIVSLNDGGEHSCRNLQCLCWTCNTRKGATSRGQLHLF